MSQAPHITSTTKSRPLEGVTVFLMTSTKSSRERLALINRCLLKLVGRLEGRCYCSLGSMDLSFESLQFDSGD